MIPVLFPVDEMTSRCLQKRKMVGQNDLNEKIDPWIQQAKNNDNIEVFAFGSGSDDNALPAAHPDVTALF